MKNNMDFFKPEDFHELSRIHGGPYQNMGEFEAMAHIANLKLKIDGITVWGVQNLIGNPNKDVPGPYWSSLGKLSNIFNNQDLSYEAKLINIRPFKIY